jgi:hypothetical protein
MPRSRAHLSQHVMLTSHTQQLTAKLANLCPSFSVGVPVLFGTHYRPPSYTPSSPKPDSNTRPTKYPKHTYLLVDREPDLCPVRKISDLNRQTRTKPHAFPLVKVVQVATPRRQVQDSPPRPTSPTDHPSPLHHDPKLRTVRQRTTLRTNTSTSTTIVRWVNRPNTRTLTTLGRHRRRILIKIQPGLRLRSLQDARRRAAAPSRSIANSSGCPAA